MAANDVEIKQVQIGSSLFDNDTGLNDMTEIQKALIAQGYEAKGTPTVSSEGILRFEYKAGTKG